MKKQKIKKTKNKKNKNLEKNIFILTCVMC